MPQHAVVQVIHAVVGVDQFTPGGFGHGINGEVAPPQVFLKGNAGVCAGFKAGIAVTCFTLGACQCVFLFCLRVQEHREILADRLITQIKHLLRRDADDHPVAFLHRQSESLVTYGAADQVDIHCCET